MPICKKCNESFPNRIRIDGKDRILKSRRYCLVCSPFGQHNTKQIHLPPKIRKKYDYSHKRQKERRLERKKKLVDMKGGGCCICGYNTSMKALGFHHVYPNRKVFSLSRLVNHSWQSILKEIVKTVLLCRNCHMEVHDNMHKDIVKEWEKRWRLWCKGCIIGCEPMGAPFDSG